MIKGSDAKDLIRAWASGMKQWLRWFTGESTVPDKRAKQILGGTVGAVVVLVVAVSLLPGGGHTPAPKQGAKKAHVTTLTPQQVAAVAAAMRFANAAHQSTTTTPKTTTTTTTAPATHRGSTHAGRVGGARRLRATTTSLT
jgi:hypothetical protein